MAAVRGAVILLEDPLHIDASASAKRKHDVLRYRATLPSTGLSVEQQIDCLIDQSTDCTLLARMYYGWEAWI